MKKEGKNISPRGEPKNTEEESGNAALSGFVAG